MHNYTVLNRFTTKTKLGNWYQQSELNDYQFKEYLYKKQNNQNSTLNNQTKLAFSNQEVNLTQNQDGFLHYGDWIMLANLHTQAILSFNINQSILGEQTYAVTTSKNSKPALRNVFQIQPVGQMSSREVKYGDKIRFIAYAGQKKIYLQSVAVSPMRSSKFSRFQQVSVTADLNSNTIWSIQHSNPKQRFDSIGQNIAINDQILIKHNLTSQWLGSQKINYVNQFGAQFQVFAKSFLSNNKTQNLFSQKSGHTSVQNTLRGQGIQNSWKIVV